MLRVCSFNVRRFSDPSNGGTCSVEKISGALAALNPVPAILCLNEVDIMRTPNALASIAQALGRMTRQGNPYNVNFFGHVRDRYGNAILTRSDFRVVASRKTHLPGGTEIVFSEGTKKLNGDIAKKGERHRIVRGMLEVDIEIRLDVNVSCGNVVGNVSHPGIDLKRDILRQISVACTHLDHIKEEERHIQLAHVNNSLSPSKDGGILLGDFNALKRADYTDTEWKRLEDRHTENNWSLPQSGCLVHLEKEEQCSTKHSWVDVFEKHHGDLSKLDPGEKFSAHVREQLYRVDYCFATRNFLQGFEIAHAFLLKSCTFSDHYPILFDFRPKTKVSVGL